MTTTSGSLAPPGKATLIAALCLAGAVALATVAAAAEPPLPAKPTQYVNDYANVLPQAARQALNSRLEQFEKDTSNQIVVAIFSKLPDGTYLEDFTVRTAESWGVGGKERDNGIVLFAFIADRKMRIEVGYGLEGAVPDSIAASIIEEIKPWFRQKDYARGIQVGVEGLIKACRNEYVGSGKTLAQRAPKGGGSFFSVFFILAFIVIVVMIRGRSHIRGRGHHGASPWWIGGPGWGETSSGGGFGGFSGGGGGDGGGFSGGGGSFGGGGASGDW